MAQRLLTARRVLAAPGLCIEGGGVLVEGARIRELLQGPGEVARRAASARLRAVDLGDAVLAPGLVNAHAHLELTALGGRVAAGASLAAWIAALVRLRRATPAEELEAGARRGADALLSSGTTTVGDIDSGGRSLRVLAGHPIRALVYREALDAGRPERTAAMTAALARALPRRRRQSEGLSPHAPYTVSVELFRELGRIARRRRLPVSVHWAESPEEREWLAEGTGPLSALLGDSPRRDGLDLIAEGGFLDAGQRGGALSLVHGNHPAPGDPERLAAAQAVLVHCPGAHRFFGRPRFDPGPYQRAGVTLALGTDSLASNGALDMTREMALFRAEHPEEEPEAVLAMATQGGARALGLEGRVGELRPGAFADFCVWSGTWSSARECVDQITSTSSAPAAVWIGGRPVTLSAP